LTGFYVNDLRLRASAGIPAIDPAELNSERTTSFTSNLSRNELGVQGEELIWVTVSPVGQTGDASDQFKGVLELLSDVTGASKGREAWGYRHIVEYVLNLSNARLRNVVSLLRLVGKREDIGCV
jgi:hypothetical protein